MTDGSLKATFSMESVTHLGGYQNMEAGMYKLQHRLLIQPGPGSAHSLPIDFVKADTCRHRYVETLNLPPHRNIDKIVA